MRFCLGRQHFTRSIKARRQAGNVLVSEHGHSLVEMLAVVAAVPVIVGAVFMPLITSQRSEARDVNYAFAQQEARTGLDAMVSEVRQAYNVLDTSSNSIDFDIYLSGTAYRVYYECDVPQ